MSILDRFRLDGRKVLVTAGAGPLFGKSISEAMAEAGATLITASRSQSRNESYAKELQERGFDAHGRQVDIEEPKSIERLYSELADRFGRIDVLVNNAVARNGHQANFLAQSPEELQVAAAGDFMGLFAMCQRFVRQMPTSDGGAIINISSIYGMVANDPDLYANTEMRQPASYSFVKAGMINFTRFLASYYGKQGIRANCISPGGYQDGQPSSFIEAYERRVPLGRMLSHEDIQGAAVFLASDASRYVTGVNLAVDGGWTCR